MKKMFFERYTNNIQEYDLKRQMWENEALTKTKKCIEDVAQYCGYSLDDIDKIFKSDEEYAIEKYLLFRAELTRKYDCDRSKIVRDFFSDKTKGKRVSYDTLFSFQYIWGAAIKGIKIPVMSEDEKESFRMSYGKRFPESMFSFIMQLKNINAIKTELKEQDKKLDIQLLPALEKLAHYYHTIGNMSPCCIGKYNLAKGDYRNYFFDRLDLFYKWLTDYDNVCEKKLYSLKGVLLEDEIHQIRKWFEDSENVVEFCLGKVINADLPESLPNSPQELMKYTNDITSIILERGKDLVSAYLVNN